jgi:hypothetical protein
MREGGRDDPFLIIKTHRGQGYRDGLSKAGSHEMTCHNYSGDFRI